MPPRAVRRPSTATPLKKRPHATIPVETTEEETMDSNHQEQEPQEPQEQKPEEEHEQEQEQEQASPTKEEEKEEEEEVPVVAEQENDRSERLELEDNYYQYGQTEDGAANAEMEEYRDDEEVEYDEERGDGDEMMDREEDQEQEEEREEDVNGDEEQDHHDVMKERRKRKEFEVFIGGLDRDATDEDLREVFAQVGEVTEIRLMRNPLTQKNKGFAFIRFATVEEARRACNELKHPTVNGKQCGVSPSQDSDTLFVGNISKTWTKAVFKDKLVQYGVDNFEELTLVEDVKNEGLNRGFAFLDFACRADALDACKRLQRMDVVFGTDRTAKVAFADTFIEPDDEIMAQVKTVFLDGLPASWDEERVSEHVNKFGKVEKIELARNMPAAKRTDFGFVTFDTHEAAVGCVDGVHNSELGDGDKKVKVRARLSRPRQRGKSSRHARGGFAVGRSFGRGGRTSWGSGGSHGDSRYGSRYERDIPSRRTYSGSYRPSFGSRDRYSDVSSTRPVSRRRAPSSERSYGRRSPGVAYRSSSKREYIRSDEHYPPRSSGYATGARSSGFVSKIRSSEYISKPPTERRGSYRDSYPSRESEYLDSPPRTATRAATRRPAPGYSEDNYVRQVERPSSYRGGHSQDYVSLSGSKRAHSSMEEYPSRFPESTLRQTRARFDYGVGNDDVQYSEYSSAYGSEPTTSRQGRGSHIGYDRGTRSSAAHSHGMYDTHTSSTSYSRDEVRRGGGDIGGAAYSSYDREYPSRDYTSTDTEVAATSYSSLYSSRRMSDAYPSGRGSGSYY